MTHDITTLPKWAQQQIGRLQRDIAYYQAKLAEGPDESNTFADPYGVRRPLGHDTTIEFVTTSGSKIRATLERDRITGLYDRLNLNGDGLIAVFPAAANSVDIKVVRR